MSDEARRETDEKRRCRCVWRGEQCTNEMTAEDLLCNWCGNGRPEAVLRADPKAVVGEDGRFFGISGAGQVHDQRYPYERPAACWYSDSGRTILGGSADV